MGSKRGRRGLQPRLEAAPRTSRSTVPARTPLLHGTFCANKGRSWCAPDPSLMAAWKAALQVPPPRTEAVRVAVQARAPIQQDL